MLFMLILLTIFAKQVNMKGVDVVERAVDFKLQKGVATDPRHMIAGREDGLDGTWISGFFDRGATSSSCFPFLTR